MKVYELSRELDIPSKELLEIMQDIGIDIKSHLSVIDDEDVVKVKDTLKVEESARESAVVVSVGKGDVQKQWKPDLERMIKIKNISPGLLIYKSKRQLGYVVEWPRSGDINYLELGEFINLKNTDRRFITEPWIRIMEDDEIEILKYANVLQYYKGLIGIDNVEGMLKLNFDSFKERFDSLPKGFKLTVAGKAAEMLQTGVLDSIKIKNYIEEDLDIELEFLMVKTKDKEE